MSAVLSEILGQIVFMRVQIVLITAESALRSGRVGTLVKQAVLADRIGNHPCIPPVRLCANQNLVSPVRRCLSRGHDSQRHPLNN